MLIYNNFKELNSPTLLDIDIFDNNQNNNQKNNSFNFDPFDLFPSKQGIIIIYLMLTNSFRFFSINSIW